MATKSNPNNQAVTGSVIVDGTSYSGADIKIVIHVYDKEVGSLQQQINDLRVTITKIGERAARGLISAGEATKRRLILLSQLAFLERNAVEFGFNEHISTKVLTEVQTLSVSTHREKYPVRSLSSVYPKSFTRGPRTIAGSMVFTVFDRNVLYDLLEADATDFDAENSYTSALIDQLPPFDITVSFANELGQTSRMAILGVEFVNEGQTMSIQDLFIENTTQWVARDIDPMSNVSRAKRDMNNQITGQAIAGLTATQLIKAPASQEWLASKDPFAARFKARSDPFK